MGSDATCSTCGQRFLEKEGHTCPGFDGEGLERRVGDLEAVVAPDVGEEDPAERAYAELVRVARREVLDAPPHEDLTARVLAALPKLTPRDAAMMLGAVAMSTGGSAADAVTRRAIDVMNALCRKVL